MKSLFKYTLLATAMAVTFSSATVFAADAPAQAEAAPAEINSAFKTADQQSAYALGASLGRYMHDALKEQEKLGITLDKTLVISGAQDAFADKSKLSDAEIEKTLKSFEVQVQTAAQSRMEREIKENSEKGDAFAAAFAKEAGVKKTDSGLLYKVEKEGEGASPKDSDTVVVNYVGTLIDGTEFDSSVKNGQPLSFRLDGVIPGWIEGLKHVKKGGKIKLVIPPQLAYGKNGVPGIPVNSTLVFDVELLDIKPEVKEKNTEAPAAEKKAAKAK
ncbi:MAG: FKBP-type peptidyl-prolyl cis-trans isomerase FkpA [Candidatus Erwinia impunctatus]|nr:FKBP-type peptidyl-prolyl cis-trans isomerase FkpA [Culicoides impunctatus]